jgi:MoaA/NifB/PqqE/SkfB family radical SAM enzyme
MLKPTRIQLDASAHCQLACCSCPTASGEVKKTLGAGHLNVADLERLLRKAPFITDIELANYGEMFLNPNLIDILQYCFENGIVTHADTGTNMNLVPGPVLEAIVKYRVRSITCSLDGACQSTYEKYRKKGNFDRVIQHIHKINNYKRIYQTGFPQLTWQFIVFGHNEHEIPLAQAKASELGMRFYTKLSWDDEFSPIKNQELVRIETGSKYTSRTEYKNGTGMDYCRRLCYQMWHAPVLNWDGRMLGCCRNFWGTYEKNAFQDGLLESMNSEMMDYARSMLTGKTDPRSDIPCSTCDVYSTLRSSGKWLTEEELAAADRRNSWILLSIVITDKDLRSVGVEIAPEGDCSRRLRQTFVPEHDFSVFFRIHHPGRYLLSLTPYSLNGEQLEKASLSIEVPERPICQEIKTSVHP